MKRKYTNDERKKIIDLIIAIAMEIHESGIIVAKQLNMPMEVVYELRECSVKVDMINPCMCEECESVGITSECKQCCRFHNSCPGTDYFRNKEHYYCIIDWKAFKNGASNTRFCEYIKGVI